MEPLWNGIPLVLQLDHINGINNDNRIENLRFLCPNCHSQTTTFSGKHAKKTDEKKCKECSTVISRRAIYCRKCIKYSPVLRFETTYEELYDMVHNQKLPFTTIGKHFGVSDNSIRKRCRKLGIEVPRKFTRS